MPEDQGIETKRAGQRIFEVAADLFYRQSIRSVGVDSIVKQAGVAKISLYRNFPSKDHLIVAYLESMNVEYWRDVDAVLARHEGNAKAQLRAYMAYIAKSATTPGYRGCPFINYAAEFPDPTHPGHRVAEANRVEMRRRLSALCKAIGVADPKRLTDGLLLLIDGAYASSQTLPGPRGPANALLWASEALVEAAL